MGSACSHSSPAAAQAPCTPPPSPRLPPARAPPKLRAPGSGRQARPSVAQAPFDSECTSRLPSLRHRRARVVRPLPPACNSRSSGSSLRLCLSSSWVPYCTTLSVSRSRSRRTCRASGQVLGTGGPGTAALATRLVPARSASLRLGRGLHAFSLAPNSPSAPSTRASRLPPVLCAA